LLEKLPAGAYTCNSEGLITYFNQRAVDLWGRAPKLNDPEDRFCGSFRLFSPDGSAIRHDQCWMALALRTNQQYNGHEIVIERPDGCRLTALAHANPIRDDSGSVFGAVNVLVDISDRKRAEEALQRADRSKDEFLATLAHELRNPLAPIRNAARILHSKRPLDPELQWASDVIERQVEQLTRLVSDLLDVSRITRGRLDLHKERVELAAIVGAAVETSSPVLEANGHVLSLSLPAQPIQVDADRIRLAQVLANLLNNAAKYTEPGGQIWLSAEAQGGDAVVTVRDTGIGIPPELLPRIFEMFNRVDRSLERSRGGLGIGLALVKRLVEMHGGSVRAHSEGAGRGSEFTVRLPAVMEPVRAPQAPEPQVGSRHTASCFRILVVDDNRDSATSLAMLLGAMGHEVRTAHDGIQGFAAADAFRAEVVLLDIGLPGMNGYDVAGKIRRQSWGERMVLIAVTGWGNERDRSRSREAGFDLHLVKPVEPVALMKLLQSLVQAKVAQAISPAGSHIPI
jgi:PAS domain S-box-containing protein